MHFDDCDYCCWISWLYWSELVEMWLCVECTMYLDANA